jgi:dihydroorotate dehydrogenase (fumarate)
VHTAVDVTKAILAGAHAVQLVSVLLKHGPEALVMLLDGLEMWMSEHDYSNLSEIRGAMNLHHCPDPAAFERANYQKILQSWKI